MYNVYVCRFVWVFCLLDSHIHMATCHIQNSGLIIFSLCVKKHEDDIS